MPQACTVTDKITGNVKHHSSHIVGYTSEGSPIYCGGHGVTGAQVKGQGKVLIQGKAAATVGDKGTTTCPCCGQGYTNQSGSSKVFINGRPAVRLGDNVNIHGQGTGQMVSGKSKVIFA